MDREATIFEQALAIGEPRERDAFLRSACAGDEPMFERLQGLLRAHDVAGRFLEHEPHPAEAAQPGGTIAGSAPAPDPASPSTAPAGVLDAQAPVRIGRYKILQKIGEGGCGLVYMAEQQEPVRRRVALKIIKPGMDTRQVIARFEAERQALALMDHPNIARILDGGVTETGRPFFVMDLVQGLPIIQFCDEARLSTRDRLALFLEVCSAIQHAHQKGIIHRDIKPSNILVTLRPDGSGLPKVIDFGIAKATEQPLTDKTLFTQYQQFIGTPAYMSPEQATLAGFDIDTRSDIYSLGVLLYELLTGKTPFDPKELVQAGLDELRRIIREEEPARPSNRVSTLPGEELTTTAQRRGIDAARLVSVLRGDLDWIVMKCLEKDRARRYETANGLARDLERHLRNEPVTARPPSAAYQLRKFVVRNKRSVTAAAIVATVVVLGLCASTLEAIRARRAEREQSRLRQAAETAQTKEAAQRQRAQAGEQLGQRLLYAGKMNMLEAAWEQNRIKQARQLLEETANYPDRGFEWYYWQRQMHLDLKTLRGHLEWADVVAFSPDGNRILTCCTDGTAKVWDVASGSELFTLNGHQHRIYAAGFSRDGRRMVTGSYDTTVRVWDASDGKELLIFRGHTGSVQDLSFSRDGQRVLSSGRDGPARLWDLASGKELFTLPRESGSYRCAQLSPDGLRIVTGGDDEVPKIWDAVTGKELLALGRAGGPVYDVNWSPNGQRIVTCGTDRTAKVWDAVTGKEVLILAGHDAWVQVARFSPDGGRIVTASMDQTASIWDAFTGKALFTIKGHTDELTDVDFSPDGRWLVTGSEDRTAKIWDATGDNSVLTLQAHTNDVLAVAISSDGRRIVTGSGDYTAKVWQAATGKLLLTLRRHQLPVFGAAFSPDGSRIAIASADQTASVWDAANGKCLFSLTGHVATVLSVNYSKDGRRIVTGSADGTARVWDAVSGKHLLTLIGHSNGVYAGAFSPDCRRIAIGSADGTGKVWDASNGRALLTLSGHSRAVISIAFSPDGRRIATASADRTAKVWEADTGKQSLSLQGHTHQVRGVAFSPDGTRLVTCSWDLTAKLWDAESGEELLTLKGHDRKVHSVVFSPDGLRIVTGSMDGTTRIWQAATEVQVSAWRQEEQSASARLAALARERAAVEADARRSSREDPGAIKQWLVLGPITYEGYLGVKALAQEQVADEAHLHPSAGERTQLTDLYWREVKMDDYLLDLHKANHIARPWSVSYACCYIQSDRDQQGLSLRIASDDQSKLYLNGKEIYRHEQPRRYVPDQDVTTGVELKAGINQLVFKALNEEDRPGLEVDGGPGLTWRASLRFTDGAGQPVKGIRVTLTPR